MHPIPGDRGRVGNTVSANQLENPTTAVFPVPNALPTVVQQFRHLGYRMIAANLWATAWMLKVPGDSLAKLHTYKKSLDLLWVKRTSI